jgi:hypothetical protein
MIDKGQTDPARLKELFEKIALQNSRTAEFSRDLGRALAEAGARST